MTAVHPTTAVHPRTAVNVVLPRGDSATAPPRLPAFVTDVRPAPTDTAVALARAADLAGLAGVVVPFDPDGPESLVTAARLLRRTRRLVVHAGLEPWVTTPQYAAKVSASLQRFSGSRLGWHVTGSGAEQFVRTAREFWSAPTGLPAVLSTSPFPAVPASGSVWLDVAGRSVDDVLALAGEHRDAEQLFLTVGPDPGEVLRLGEYLLPFLATRREPARVG